MIRKYLKQDTQITPGRKKIDIFFYFNDLAYLLIKHYDYNETRGSQFR